MPTYEYICTCCKHESEQFQSMKDEPLTDCEACGEVDCLERQFGTGSGVIFKGTGFWQNDRKK